jgi:hypothetical protein
MRSVRAAGLARRKVQYDDTIAFPLSGVYIGRKPVANWRRLGRAAMGIDAAVRGLSPFRPD